MTIIETLSDRLAAACAKAEDGDCTIEYDAPSADDDCMKTTLYIAVWHDDDDGYFRRLAELLERLAGELRGRV